MKKTIVLIDLLSGGHRDAFMQFFAKACLEQNCRVVCVYPDTALIREWVDQNIPQYKEDMSYVDNTIKTTIYSSFGRFNDPLKALTLWRRSASLVKKIEKENKIKTDLVFFNCIDYFLGNSVPSFLLDMLFPYKWSGLYFHPAVFRRNPASIEKPITFRDVDSIFLSKNCVAVTLHDEGIIKRYQQRINKPVFLFPEIADATPAGENNSMAQEIRKLANGRIIIGTIGLEPYKGCFELMRLVKIANPAHYFFAFTGGWGGEEWKLYFNDDSRAEEFFEFEKHLPENCYWNTGVLEEGSEYNSLFNAFDVIWLMYKKFYSSSNRLTKAAIFHKLVLASDKGCVGDDVPAYDLGATADENDTADQLKKLELLRQKILAKDFPEEQWKIYAAKHSVASLNEKFAELLNLV